MDFGSKNKTRIEAKLMVRRFVFIIRINVLIGFERKSIRQTCAEVAESFTIALFCARSAIQFESTTIRGDGEKCGHHHVPCP